MKEQHGKIKMINSFAIKRRKEFYLLVELLEGLVAENYFVNVALNNALYLTLKISKIETLAFPNDENEYKLLVIFCTEEETDLLLSLNIGNEILTITINGED